MLIALPLSFVQIVFRTGRIQGVRSKGCKQGVGGSEDGSLTIYDITGTASYAYGSPLSYLGDINGVFTFGQTMTGVNLDFSGMLSIGSWFGSTAGGGAPNKGSPAHQKCVANAQQKNSQAKTAAVNSALKGALIGGGITAGVQFAAGCAVGGGAGTILGGLGTIVLGGEGAFAGAPVGCVTGGVSAVLDGLPQSVLVGAITGGISYWMDSSAANAALNQDLQACNQIP